MLFTKGNTLSTGRPKGSGNKINDQLADKLDGIINGIVETLDIDYLNTSQKIKVLQMLLQYRLPKLQALAVSDSREDIPIFDQIQIVTSMDEKQRSEKVEAYEKEVEKLIGAFSLY